MTYRLRWARFVGCAMCLGIACAGPSRESSVGVHDDVTILFGSGRLIVPVPKGWVIQSVSAIGFEGDLFIIGPPGGHRCDGAVLVDSYGGSGNATCGAASTTDRPGTLFGVPVTWKVGRVMFAPCSEGAVEVLWSRALLPGKDLGGIQLFARSRDQLDQLMEFVSGMRLEGAAKFDPKRRVDQGERWYFTPEACLPPE